MIENINGKFDLSIYLVERLFEKIKRDKEYRKRMLLRKKKFPMHLYPKTKDKQIKKFKKEQLEMLKADKKTLDICKKELKLLRMLKTKGG